MSAPTKLDRAVADAVAAAPPLTADQRDRAARLLGTARDVR